MPLPPLAHTAASCLLLVSCPALPYPALPCPNLANPAQTCHAIIPFLTLQPGFLEAFAALRPDLAVTAAYGNMLPQARIEGGRLGRFTSGRRHPAIC